jgi:hypothetical protein
MHPSDVLLKEYVEPDWIVRQVIPKGYMTILAGSEGIGKSYLMYDLCYAIVTNQKFLGFQTVPTRIVYFDEENGEPDFITYNQRAWRTHGSPDPKIVDDLLRLEHFSLLRGWKEPMAKALKEHKPGLVIIDTATPAFHVEDENSNSEANVIIGALRRMREECCPGATFIVLKHEKMRDDVTHRRTIRGAKTWLGAFDQTLYYSAAPGAKKRKNGLRKTILEQEKLRSIGLDHAIGVDPAFDGPDKKMLFLHTYSVAEDAD